MHWTDFTIRIVEILLVPILTYGAYILRDIRNEMRRMNGRMVSMEVWRTMHDKQDDERHHDVITRIGGRRA